MKGDKLIKTFLNPLGSETRVYRGISELAIAKMEEPKLSIRAAKEWGLLDLSTSTHYDQIRVLGGVPRNLISQRVKIPPVLFTRIGAEANSGRVSLARGNLKSLRLSLARSESEPVVGYAK